jgi:GNAT superfamily N-acetyltransferase
MARYCVTVRRATRRDVPGILDLVNQWYREDGEKPIQALSSRIMKACFGRTRVDHLLVAVDEDGLAGYAHVHPMYDIGIEEPHLMLEDLYVTKAKRSLGVGAKLMSAIARLAKQEGAVGMVWVVYRGNRRGRKFYLSQGAVKSEYDTLYFKGRALTAKARSVAAI